MRMNLLKAWSSLLDQVLLYKKTRDLAFLCNLIKDMYTCDYISLHVKKRMLGAIEEERERIKPAHVHAVWEMRDYDSRIEFCQRMIKQLKRRKK